MACPIPRKDMLTRSRTILAQPFYVTGADGHLASRIDAQNLDSYLWQMALAIAFEPLIPTRTADTREFVRENQL